MPLFLTLLGMAELAFGTFDTLHNIVGDAGAGAWLRPILLLGFGGLTLGLGHLTALYAQANR